MADLLTHVLVAYVLMTIASWWVEWIEPRWIVVAMGGAAIPDLVKIGIVLDSSVIESALGIPFSYGPISSLGGVLVIAAAIALLFEQERRQAYAFLVLGGSMSLIGDGLRVFVDGYAGYWLYPLWWRPPTPSLYVTSDVRVLVGALLVSAVVFVVDRYSSVAD